MTDLREQLLKAGLITEAQVTRNDDAGPRTGRQRRKRGGGGKSQDTRRVERREVVDVTPEGAASAAQIASDGRVEVKTPRNGRRWYYVSRDGLVPYVELSDDVADKVSRGELALVESTDGDSWFVARDAAMRILELDPDWVRAFGA